MSEAVGLVAAGNPPRVQQDESQASYEGPWEGDIAKVDWSQPADVVHNLIRGSDRQPGAWTVLNGVRLTLHGSQREGGSLGPIGTVLAADESGMTIRCGGGGSVRIERSGPKASRRSRPAPGRSAPRSVPASAATSDPRAAAARLR